MCLCVCVNRGGLTIQRKVSSIALVPVLVDNVNDFRDYNSVCAYGSLVENMETTVQLEGIRR